MLQQSWAWRRLFAKVQRMNGGPCRSIRHVEDVRVRARSFCIDQERERSRRRPRIMNLIGPTRRPEIDEYAIKFIIGAIAAKTLAKRSP